jgi:phage portal protein BeeE
LARYLNDYLSFSFNGNNYPFVPQQTLPGEKQEPPENTFEGYVRAGYQQNGVIFACMLVRLLLFSEARFQFRRIRSGRPGELWGNAELDILEHPWPGGTTGDLLTRMEQDASLAGNAYVTRRGDQLRRLRPDWVAIVTGTPAGGVEYLDVDVVGYLYYPGGPTSREEPVMLLPETVAHYAPIPDPCARFRGMSWLTPIVLELMADSAATTHKLKFFENGATPNLALKYDASVSTDQFKEAVRMFEEKFGEANGGAYLNAYKTLHLKGGADPIPIGTNLQQLDFKVTQGGGETRIAAAAGVPPVIVGLSEGLQSATYSNYGQARRRFADGTMRPLWRNAAGSLSRLITVQSSSELWYDDRDIPFLQEDLRDAAEVQQMQMAAMKSGIDAGWEPDAVVDAVVAGDLGRLKGSHTGLNSVQLQPPGTVAKPEPEPAGNGTPDTQAVADKLAQLAKTKTGGKP